MKRGSTSNLKHLDFRAFLPYAPRLFLSLAISLPSPRTTSLLLPPVSVLLRNVVPWRDYFWRWSPKPSFTHNPFEATLHRSTSAFGRIQYDEDASEAISACNPVDLDLLEAACFNSEWQAWVMEATSEAGKWRGKALKEKMEVMELVYSEVSDKLGNRSEGDNVSNSEGSESGESFSGADVDGEDRSTRASSALADLLQPAPLSPTNSTIGVDAGATTEAIVQAITENTTQTIAETTAEITIGAKAEPATEVDTDTDGAAPHIDFSDPLDTLNLGTTVAHLHSPQDEQQTDSQAVILELREEIRRLKLDNARQAEELAAARLRAQKVDPGDGGLLLALSRSVSRTGEYNFLILQSRALPP